MLHRDVVRVKCVGGVTFSFDRREGEFVIYFGSVPERRRLR
jgi:hypothetical protein